MMGRPLLTMDGAADILWPNPNFMPEYWVTCIRRSIFELRIALAGTEWRVRTDWGQGYRLDHAE